MLHSFLSGTIGKLFELLNIESIERSAFFYNGCSELESSTSQITDRPVYIVRPSDDRMVSGYDVLNGTPENGLRICLKDVVDKNYTLNPKTPSVLRKSR